MDVINLKQTTIYIAHHNLHIIMAGMIIAGIPIIIPGTTIIIGIVGMIVPGTGMIIKMAGKVIGGVEMRGRKRFFVTFQGFTVITAAGMTPKTIPVIPKMISVVTKTILVITKATAVVARIPPVINRGTVVITKTPGVVAKTVPGSPLMMQSGAGSGRPATDAFFIAAIFPPGD